ncbi:MAG: thioether cross-link-forming SCIFF peptide maturase [Clostridiaceae bacterium]|jgi:uncharacterized protein|nr:thioether cross-link-forming SCIFF peptide maturase [Clostridiaceae bacterium]
MVFAFSATVKDGAVGYYIWDSESGSLLREGRAAFLVCKNRFQTLDDEERAAFAEISASERAEIEVELDELEKEGTIGGKDTPLKLPFTGDIKALCLHICHDCNLRCRYCFAAEGTYNTARDYMTFETGKAALDFLFVHSGRRKNLEADFFGGEPLMNFGVVKKIVAYGRETAAKFGKNIGFTMTTNGVLLNAEAREYLNREMDNVVISIDGRREVHDALRKTPNGKGSYDTAVKNALEFKRIRGNKKYYIRGTFTRNNLDFASDVLHLNDLGFDQISLEPVVLDPSSPEAFLPEDYAVILAEYDRLAAAYSERLNTPKRFNFFHFMLDLNKGPCAIKRLKGCGAGEEYLAVSPQGEIYPCHRFVGGDKAYRMGDVHTGAFDRDIQKNFADVSVYSKKECASCIAKYYCSGGCAANSLFFAGGLDKPHKESCLLMKKRFELSLALAAENSQSSI